MHCMLVKLHRNSVVPRLEIQRWGTLVRSRSGFFFFLLIVVVFLEYDTLRTCKRSQIETFLVIHHLDSITIEKKNIHTHIFWLIENVKFKFTQSFADLIRYFWQKFFLHGYTFRSLSYRSKNKNRQKIGAEYLSCLDCFVQRWVAWVFSSMLYSKYLKCIATGFFNQIQYLYFNFPFLFFSGTFNAFGTTARGAVPIKSADTNHVREAFAWIAKQTVFTAE